MFLGFINYSTLTTDQRIQATLMQNLFENVHTVREEEATWSGRLPCAFFQSLPSGIPLLQPIIMMPLSMTKRARNALGIITTVFCYTKIFFTLRRNQIRALRSDISRGPATQAILLNEERYNSFAKSAKNACFLILISAVVLKLMVNK